VLDRDSLDVLKEIMEEEFVPLIELFVRDSDLRFPAMRRSLAEGDSEAVRHTVHSLKGASSNICATQLAGEARAVELLAIDADLESLPEAIDALEASYRAVREELLTLI